MVDMMNVEFPFEVLQKLKHLPSVVVLHRGVDENNTNKSKQIREFGARTNIWRITNSGGFGQKDKNAYKHPATMPEELARGHIQTWSNPGDLVFDPFMGSGTTAFISQQENRNFLGFEIDPEYHQICEKRFQ